MFMSNFVKTMAKMIKSPQEQINQCMNCRHRFACAGEIIKHLPMDKFVKEIAKQMYKCAKEDLYDPEGVIFPDSVNRILKKEFRK